MSKENYSNIDINFYKTVSMRLLSLRKSLNLKRYTVAKDIETKIRKSYNPDFNFHPTLLRQYEIGKIKIPLSKLKLLSDYYNYPVDLLIPDSYLEISSNHKPELTEIHKKMSSITSQIVQLNSIITKIKAEKDLENDSKEKSAIK
jgi:transcriptional regulator with XRE-family HTH domain